MNHVVFIASLQEYALMEIHIEFTCKKVIMSFQ